jgi:hypothetical protein
MRHNTRYESNMIRHHKAKIWDIRKWHHIIRVSDEHDVVLIQSCFGIESSGTTTNQPTIDSLLVQLFLHFSFIIGIFFFSILFPPFQNCFLFIIRVFDLFISQITIWDYNFPLFFNSPFHFLILTIVFLVLFLMIWMLSLMGVLAFACFQLISSFFHIQFFFFSFNFLWSECYLFFMGVLALACFQLRHSFFTFKICLFILNKKKIVFLVLLLMIWVLYLMGVLALPCFQ